MTCVSDSYNEFDSQVTELTKRENKLTEREAELTGRRGKQGRERERVSRTIIGSQSVRVRQ